MAQASPITDVTQRLFADLKSKNDDIKARAAFELHDNVVAVSRGKSPTLLSLESSYALANLAALLLQIGRPRNSTSFTTPSVSGSHSS